MLEDLQQLYQEVILDHGRSPRNFRRPDHPIVLRSRPQPDVRRYADRVSEHCDGEKKDHRRSVHRQGLRHFHGFRFADDRSPPRQDRRRQRTIFSRPSIACAREDDVALSDAAGIDPDEAERLEVLAGVRQFPVRVKCATLAWHAMHAALHGDGETTTE